MKLTKDLLAGLFFAGIGLCVVLTARDYPFGTIRHMGPAYFPTLLGGLVAVLGVALAGRALLRPESSAPVAGFRLRPVAAILGAIVAFALALDGGGLAVAVTAVVVLSGLARKGPHPVEMAVMAAALTALCYALFVVGFGIPFALWPTLPGAAG